MTVKEIIREEWLRRNSNLVTEGKGKENGVIKICIKKYY